MSTNTESGPGLSLRIVPGPSSGSSSNTTHLSTTSTAAPEHAGIHDTLRYGTRSLAFDTAGSDDGAARHPVQARLEGWEETRDTLKTTLQRNMYGLGAPLRMSMERRAVEWDPHFPSLHNYPGNGIGGSTRGGFSQLQRDILDGNDETLSPKDFLPTPVSGGPRADLHAVMERKYGI